MTVLHLVSSGGMYGAEKFILNLLAALPQAGVSLVLAVFDNSRNPHTEIASAARTLGVPVEVIPCNGRVDRSAVTLLREHLRKHSVDLLHTHGYKADLYGFAAARQLGIPIVATCHNWTDDSLSIRLYSALDRMVLKRFHRVAAVSAGVVARLREAGVPEPGIVHIPNGVAVPPPRAHAPSRYVGIDLSGRLVVGLVGRLVPNKGFHIAIEASASLRSDFPNVLFLVAGAGPAQHALEARICELGMGGSFVLVGECRDIDHFYRCCDVFLSPSLNEGMPLAVLEAMAAELPVIATRVGAVPEMLREGDAGLLVDPGDRHGLEDALRTLLPDEALRQRLGAAARSVVEQNYSIDAMAKRYCSIYRLLCPTPEVVPRDRFSRPAMSVVIPAFNSAATLGRCLEGLAASDVDLSSVEVIVGDNGSFDNTVALANTFSGRLNLSVFSLPGVTISAVRNAAARQAMAERLAFLDSDCVPPRDWLKNAIAHLDACGSGAVGCWYSIPPDSTWVARTWRCNQSQKPGPVSYIPGGSLITTRSSFERIGGFDEALQTNEDYDFCQRMIESGGTVLAFEDLSVCHLGEAQTLRRFYGKQRWHGSHVFRVFLRSLPRLKNARAVAFAVYFSLCFLGAAAGVIAAASGHVAMLALSVAAMLAAPLAASFRAGIRRHDYQFVLPLAVLFFVYGAARAVSLLDIRNHRAPERRPLAQPVGGSRLQ